MHLVDLTKCKSTGNKCFAQIHVSCMHMHIGLPTRLCIIENVL